MYTVTGLQIRCVKWTSIGYTCVISSPNSMFDHLLESSLWDDSNKWSNIGFGEKINIIDIKICTLSGALMKWTVPGTWRVCLHCWPGTGGCSTLPPWSLPHLPSRWLFLAPSLPGASGPCMGNSPRRLSPPEILETANLQNNKMLTFLFLNQTLWCYHSSETIPMRVTS